MSNPSPVVINFACKGINEALKAIRSISDAVAQVEHKSTAVATAQSSERTKAAEKESKATAAAAIQTSQMMQAAQRAGTKTVEQELKVRLANQIRHLNAIHDAEVKKQDAITAKSKAASTEYQKTQEQKFRQLEKLAEKWKSDELGAIDSVTKARQRAANIASGSISKQIEVERNRAHHEILRGGAAPSPALSPQARLTALKTSEGKTLEEQKAILDKVVGMREQAIGSRQRSAQDLAEYKSLEAAKTKETEAAEKARLAIRERSATMAGQFAASEAKKEQHQRNEFARTVVSAGGRGIRNAALASGAAAFGVGRMVTNLGGGFSVEDSLQREIQLQGHAATIAETTQNEGRDTKDIVTKDKLLASARAVAIKQGMDPNEVLSGFEQVKKLSDKDLPQAMRIMPQMAKLSTVTGTSLGDMGNLAANILAAVPNGQKLSDADLYKQLRIFTRQGIEGGVEVSDFAKYGTRITSAAGLFGGNREENEAILGGAAQIARQRGSASTPAEASMAALRLGTDLAKKAEHLRKAFHIEVNDSSGKTMRSPEEILIDMVKKDSSVTGISEFKLGERGNRVLAGVADIYRSAGGGEAGEKAVRDEFAKYKKDISEADVEERNKKRLAETDKQLEIAMIGLRTAVGQKLVPEITKLIPELVRLTPTVARLLSGLADVAAWAGRHPFAGFGALVMGFFMKELAAAQIAKTIQSLMSGQGFGGGVSGALGKAGAVAGVGLGAALATKELVDYGFEQDKKKDDSRMGRQLEAINLATAARHGGLTSEQRARAEQLQAQLQKDLAPEGHSAVKAVTNAFGHVFSPTATKEAEATEARESARAQKETTDALKMVAKALQENTKATQANSNAAGGGGANQPKPPGVPSGGQPGPQPSNRR